MRVPPIVQFPTICLLLLVVGCTAPVSSPRSGASAPAPFASGGLGLTKAEWEQHHVSVDVSTDTINRMEVPISIIYDNGEYRVYFWNDWPPDPPSGTALISQIAFYPRTKGLDARRAFHRLLPADAQFQRREEVTGLGAQDPAPIREIYRSATLAVRYPALSSQPNPWGDDPPGTIYVVYSANDSYVYLVAGSQPAPPPPKSTGPKPTPCSRKGCPTPTLPTPRPTWPPPIPVPSGVPPVPVPSNIPKPLSPTAVVTKHP